MTKKLPIAPLPEPMTGLDPQSWAYDTVTRRWPEILQRIFAENELTPSLTNKLNTLLADLPKSPIREIDDPGAPDLEAWNGYIQEYLGKNWLEPPWFFSEHYFYRRVIEAIGYFQSGFGQGLDPFIYQKRRGLEISQSATRDLADRLIDWTRPGGDRSTLIRMVYLDLWGNQADLSMWPAGQEIKPDHGDLGKAREFLLDDNAAAVADYLLDSENPVSRIDFMIDNAGFELVSDLALADYLLSSEITTAVRLHVKPHPTYVSDAMPKDVSATLDFFEADQHPATRKLGSRLKSYWYQDRLQVSDNFFWTSPLPAWEMLPSLRNELSRSNLVISKGDANYRRLLGDLDWPYVTPFADTLSYFPAPILALRTVKAEIACGLQPKQAEQVAAQDPDWMVNGRWGMVQFARPLAKAG
jgi:uncharacterized protein with ATP-grasp and redox domains